MKFSQLGSSKYMVSRVCYGTMTIGKQNDQKQGFELMDYALERDINFFDTAEMYAVPPSKETYGATERIMGNWFKANPGKREKVIVATKMAGPGLSYIRNGRKMSGADLKLAVEDSLKRLQSDHIELYQLHWPNRPGPQFNRHWFKKVDFSSIDKEKERDNMLDVLKALDDCVKEGKIGYCGLSNESAWGIEQYLQLAKEFNLPTMISLQNEFSLVQSKDWPYVIESCVVNDIAYLPWSPLGSGVLSGKYANGAVPEGSRWSFAGRHGNFRNQDMVHKAVAEYKAVADKYNITVAQLSLAWCDQFDWVTSTIIGATNLNQLKENIDAFQLELPKEAYDDIDQVLRKYPIPYA